MVYLEHQPSWPLAAFVQKLWYVCAPKIPHRYERVLPTGCQQIIISLASEKLTDCSSHSILVGARGRFELIDMRDLAELVGIVLKPGGFGPWLRHRAAGFFEQSIPLDQVCKNHDWRGRLQEPLTPKQKLATLDNLLVQSLQGRAVSPHPVIRQALVLLGEQNVRQTALTVGISERRLHQLFQDDVGLSPKLWSRLQRFQLAVAALYAGQSMRWDRLALDCGYCDQSHFSNDFHSFSGIPPSGYHSNRGPWRNHVVVA